MPLLLQALLVLQLCHAPPLPLVCVPHCTLGCCDGGTVGCCIKGFEALERHLLACRSTQQQHSRQQQQGESSPTRNTW